MIKTLPRCVKICRRSHILQFAYIYTLFPCLQTPPKYLLYSMYKQYHDPKLREHLQTTKLYRCESPICDSLEDVQRSLPTKCYTCRMTEYLEWRREETGILLCSRWSESSSDTDDEGNEHTTSHVGDVGRALKD
jgi:hypothetical protein